MAQSVTDLYRLQPNSEWLQFYDSLDVPDYYTTWSAIITTLLTLILPESFVLPVAISLANAFGVNDDSKQFLEDHYIPEITRAFRKRRLNPFKKFKLLAHAMKMTKKMIYAFSFQESTFDIDILTSPLINKIGGNLQLPFNLKTELLTPSNKGISGRLLKASDTKHKDLKFQRKGGRGENIFSSCQLSITPS